MSRNELTLEQKQQSAGILEFVCQELEITATQYKDAEKKYKAVGDWLSDSDDLRLADSSIYSQGSIRVGTTVKPLYREEFDVDLVCYVPHVESPTPAQIRDLVGRRLIGNKTYEDLLEPLNRAWRINYANKFHLDITPVIRNPGCDNGGVLVPDKQLNNWKPSNPNGYAEWFDANAAVQPSYQRAFFESGIASRDIQPLPDQQQLKGVLRRSVQLMKRHRDVYFSNKPDAEKACSPISVIITTLATHAYQNLVGSDSFDNDLDLLMAVLRSMPRYIQVTDFAGRNMYYIMNPSTDGENFAEKWNVHPERADWFYAWHKAAVNSLEEFVYGELQGIDKVQDLLTETFGASVSKRALEHYSNVVSGARSKGALSMGATGGLTTGAGREIPKNTFYGE
ncbi:nucleotidyltransferase [Thiohalophilus sp.]|uniref:nucleotidyltransferase domain-containing protein n=1 Tax=Thiohalophilus sp. TaxID=3028392 RepID=UPI002ACEED50|nr:nucleotidyltransferase [Thiohalophilus sp.]MDZ7662525.1 nucleotidyltransferase [Thiohalophilus sp.]